MTLTSPHGERNISSDFLTRCSEDAIPPRWEANGAMRMWIPKTWTPNAHKWQQEVEFTLQHRICMESRFRISAGMMTCCEWRPGIYGLVTHAQKYHVECVVFGRPHTHVLNMLGPIDECTNQQITLIGGMVWVECGLFDFAWGVGEAKPVVGVAIGPYAITEPQN